MNITPVNVNATFARQFRMMSQNDVCDKLFKLTLI